jgi:UDP-glucose 4-epimerase
MKILVVGSNGFIGSHVAAHLGDHHSVATADITPAAGSEHYLIDADAPDFDTLIAAARPDVCINCTGAADVGASIRMPALDFTLNVLRVEQLLEALRRQAPGARFIHFSSAAIYGNPVQIPTPETCAPAPISPYGWHKLQAELVCREYAELHGVGTLSLRVFSAFGPGLRRQLLWDIWRKSRQGSRLTLFGTGEEARDFIYVKDLARCVGLLIERAVFDGSAVNVAGGTMVTVRTVAETLLRAVGWDGEILFSQELRRGDPTIWQADLSYLRHLGYRAAYSFESAVEELAPWLLEQE